MSNDPKNPRPGELAIDASSLQEKVVDLAEGGLKGLSREGSGCQTSVTEINVNQETHGGKAGVTDVDVKILNELHRTIEEIDRYLPAAIKLVELLKESRAHYEDKRERQIKLVALSVEQRSEQSKDTDLLARYQKTREYYSRNGRKAALARKKRKNSEEIKEEVKV